MYEAAVVTVCTPETSEVILGSRAIATSYRTAPSTGIQLNRSGFVGNKIDFPLSGDSSFGAALQTLLERVRDPLRDRAVLVIPRTRHQYVPFGSVCESVADVLNVEKFPAPPRTGAWNFRSLASSNW